ncbi:MAG: 4Fe-4S dicluster domain-containing protein [Desulfobacterales bacterium]|nr:4Fe-4S dicluster domain-containing protein [Desulfobacterales bacterium]
MAEMAIFIDVYKCTACRACQVACKNWNQLKADKTESRGSHENPTDLSANTWNRIRFREVLMPDGKIDWSFFSDRCRHCDPAPCMEASKIPEAIVKHETGAVLFGEKTKELYFQDIRDACPFDIPRMDEKTKKIVKCTLCIDRVTNGLKPACVTACSTSALLYGPKADMINLAKKRVKELGGNACLYPGEEFNTIWALPDTPKHYGIAEAPKIHNYMFAGSKLFSPLGKASLAVGLIGYMRTRTERNQ